MSAYVEGKNKTRGSRGVREATEMKVDESRGCSRYTVVGFPSRHSERGTSDKQEAQEEGVFKKADTSDAESFPRRMRQ